MPRAHLLLALLAANITTAWAAAEPAPLMLGNLKATQFQTCGKGIEVQVADLKGTDGNRTVIGLKNNKTGDLDLFASANVSAKEKQYDKYQPVNYDNLSQTFIAVDNGRPDIVWGGAVTNLKGMEYSLALGTHVYTCTNLTPFAGEVANDLYGEPAKTAG
jgi:hypothetical protein